MNAWQPHRLMPLRIRLTPPDVHPVSGVAQSHAPGTMGGGGGVDGGEGGIVSWCT